MALGDGESPATDDGPHAPATPASRSTVLPSWLAKLAAAALGLFLFILALELLKDGARGYGRDIMALLRVTSPVNALGFGWLLAYIFLSGSPVAAIAITFFSSGTIDAVQTFTMITGSRLGASFIVLFVGFIYYLRGYQRSSSIAIGVLALLTTAAIYVPALFIGYWVLTSGVFGQIGVSAEAPLESFLDLIYGPILAAIKGLGLPGWIVFVAGVAALVAAFHLLDRALPAIDANQSGFGQIGRLVYRPVAMFILGMAVTSVTLSVSVSLSILVPLSARGLVRRENTLPYIMGANITTFIDTLVAALIVGGPPAFVIVLVEMVSVALLSALVLLLWYRPFQRLVLRAQELIIRSNRTLGAFLCIMLLVPLVLLLL
jgi:solute carrier family 34 (sodium-dependent phosphate cotransporter)